MIKILTLLLATTLVFSSARASQPDPNAYPLVYHIKASNVAGISHIYFYYFVENAPGSKEQKLTHYGQEYFNPCIEIPVK